MISPLPLLVEEVAFFVKEEWRGGNPNIQGPYRVPKGTTRKRALDIVKIPMIEVLECDFPDKKISPRETIYLRWHKRQPVNKAPH